MIRSKILCLLCAGSMLSGSGLAQNGNPSVTVSPDVNSLKYDTNYITKYPTKLVIGLTQSEKHFEVFLKDTFLNYKDVKFKANSAHSLGLSLDFDILGVGFDFYSYPVKNDPLGGKTEYRGLSLNFNAGKFRSENSIKKYQGFYDENSFIDTVEGVPVYGYIPKDSGAQFYYDPSMSIFMFKSKLLYTFNNRKFSLGSSYASVARQLKTAFSWMLAGTIYTNRAWSDSGLIPSALRSVHDSLWGNWNNLQTSGLSLGGGGSVNFVVRKRWFLNLSLNGMFDLQRQYYSSREGEIADLGKMGWSQDARAAFGYNAPRFFIRILGKWDSNNWATADKYMLWDQTFFYGEFTIGWRFSPPIPKFYKRFQESKVYRRWF
ncbi:MAG: DUF4421 family protein [Bacteroidia bacterium]|nr:DUF4421 family protein [Bacteroidia bacterium]